MKELFETVTNLTTLRTFLNKYFITTDSTETLTFDTIAYNNLFIKYVPIVSGLGMYYFSHKNSTIGFRMINELLLKQMTFNIKKELLENFYNNTSEMIPYKLLQGTDVVSEINDDSEFHNNNN